MSISKLVAIALFATAVLTGCASFQLSLMSRETGKAYSGTAQQTGQGRGTVSITIDDKTYTGPYARTSSTEVSGFINSYAKNNKGGRASSFTTFNSFGGNITAMALLSAPDGSGMKCALQGDSSTGTGGGLCVDSNGKEYDIIYTLSSY